VRRTMEPWGANLHMPLCIDIFWQGPDSSAQQQQQQQQTAPAAQAPPPRALLERWRISYLPQSMPPLGDTLAALRHVCKRIVILLRTLYSYVRMMPAYQLHRRIQAARSGYRVPVARGEDLGFCLAAQAGASGLEFPVHTPTREYKFGPLDTPYGSLVITTDYRRGLDLSSGGAVAASGASPRAAAAATAAGAPWGALIESNVIIPDYMRTRHSDHQQQQQRRSSAAAAAEPMSGLGAQLQAHDNLSRGRRHNDQQQQQQQQYGAQSPLERPRKSLLAAAHGPHSASAGELDLSPTRQEFADAVVRPQYQQQHHQQQQQQQAVSSGQQQQQQQQQQRWWGAGVPIPQQNRGHDSSNDSTEEVSYALFM
jgi:Autophagy-related protein 13